MTDAKKLNVEWVAVLISCFGILVNLGIGVWWAGRIDQRVATIEATVKVQGELISGSNALNSRQDQALAINTTQYQEIVRRLDRIDNKLDRR